MPESRAHLPGWEDHVPSCCRGAVIHISDRGKVLRAGIRAVLIVTLPLGGPVLAAESLIAELPMAELPMADPPPLTASAVLQVAPTGVDAQLLCASPITELQASLAAAMATGQVKTEHKQAFLRSLARCRSVYQVEMQRLNSDFAGLAEDSYCHAAQHGLHEGEAIFSAIETRARGLPMHTAEGRQAAGNFFRLNSPGLVRAVNGLYLLRHGVCMEEQSAPF